MESESVVETTSSGLTRYSLEPVTLELCEELLPLLVKHYKEVAHYQDIELDPDFDAYMAMDKAGILRVFTARRGRELIGYSIYILKRNAHYKGSLQALQDILFIDPKKRGFGAKFILWCDQKLKAEGVQVVYHHVKVKPELNFGPMLERFGYELIDQVYGRRLDEEK